jgi:hypothetical protein
MTLGDVSQLPQSPDWVSVVNGTLRANLSPRNVNANQWLERLSQLRILLMEFIRLSRSFHMLRRAFLEKINSLPDKLFRVRAKVLEDSA